MTIKSLITTLVLVTATSAAVADVPRDRYDRDRYDGRYDRDRYEGRARGRYDDQHRWGRD
ncbi:MAG: PepSY domain-containing protein, partial [Deltaproteobacteria bacterium]|nr:PepSY domain-containing protein [Deltaproteobacteria bacterium]